MRYVADIISFARANPAVFWTIFAVCVAVGGYAYSKSKDGK